MRNPIHRVSRILHMYLGKEKPIEATTTVSQADARTLVQFLSASRERYLQDIRSTPSKGGDWTVIMGNEAGDLDSVASSIAYAWLLSEVHNKPSIPLLQLERDDLDLRAENTHALSLAGITQPKEQLLFLTDLAPFSLTAPTAAFPSYTFALVDHNTLASAYTFQNPLATVTNILDHHADEGNHLSASPHIIIPSGSCTSHVSALFPPEIPATLATLLLTGILIDTNSLKPGGKALDIDHTAMAFLAPRSTLASQLSLASISSPCADAFTQPEVLYNTTAIKDLTYRLNNLKGSIDHLSARDHLRRDYKEYVLDVPGARSIRVGLASVPMEERELQVLGVLTSLYGGSKGKKKFKREMVWVVYDGRKKDKEEQILLDVPALAKKLFKGLERSEELKVKLKKMKMYDMEKGGRLPDGARSP
ncbi:hypothetical protein C0989_005689 [Termitomyces sp. Mn162]|nr:hypothetical protein C0989_005689 [Termitomyces sp. Mn162]